MKFNLIMKLFAKLKKKEIKKEEPVVEPPKVDDVEKYFYVPKDRSSPLVFQDEVNNELWFNGNSG